MGSRPRTREHFPTMRDRSFGRRVRRVRSRIMTTNIALDIIADANHELQMRIAAAIEENLSTNPQETES